MEKIKKMLMPVLLGSLLVAILVGVAGASRNDRPLASPGTKLTIPAAYFHPVNDDCDYENSGVYLYLISGTCTFTAPVFFPGKVRVNSITLYAYDNNASHDIGVNLYRTVPHKVTEKLMGFASTNGSSPTLPRVFTDSSLAFNPVRRTHGAYLWLTIGDNDSLDFYGVRIDYTKV